MADKEMLIKRHWETTYPLDPRTCLTVIRLNPSQFLYLHVTEKHPLTWHFKLPLTPTKRCCETGVLDWQRDTVEGINAAIDIEAGGSRKKTD